MPQKLIASGGVAPWSTAMKKRWITVLGMLFDARMTNNRGES